MKHFQLEDILQQLDEKDTTMIQYLREQGLSIAIFSSGLSTRSSQKFELTSFSGGQYYYNKSHILCCQNLIQM